MEIIIEIIQITLPAGLVLYGMYLVVRSQVSKEVEKLQLEIRGKSVETVLPNRLHAYERITLLLERLLPQNLVTRLNNGDYTAREFQQILLAEIRNEYNHNVSQQVYMSDEVWDLVKTAKEDLIVTINNAAAEMKDDAKALDLSRSIIDLYVQKEPDPLSHALLVLKNEIRQTY